MAPSEINLHGHNPNGTHERVFEKFRTNGSMWESQREKEAESKMKAH